MIPAFVLAAQEEEWIASFASLPFGLKSQKKIHPLY
jgi:hypothetical protein